MSNVQKIIVNINVSFLEFEADKIYVISSEKWLEHEEAFKVAVQFAQTCHENLTFDEDTSSFADPDQEILVKVTEVERYDNEDGFIFEELAPRSINLVDVEDAEHANIAEVEKYIQANKKG